MALATEKFDGDIITTVLLKCYDSVRNEYYPNMVFLKSRPFNSCRIS